MAAAYLQVSWHTLSEPNTVGANDFEKIEIERLTLISQLIPSYHSTYFAHNFIGGYMAADFSYLWREVLDADAFAAVEEVVILDKE
ncbi:MAG: peptidyl-dipeptidase Dcp [Roseivirga sp.]|jgi:peptidyl-dipeptidase Dcp